MLAFYFAQHSFNIFNKQFTAGLILAVWEFPVIYTCIPSFDAVQKILLETLYLKLDVSKSVLYIFLSIIFFLYPTLCIIPGIFLLFTGVLFAFSAYNKHVDSLDGTSSLSENSDNLPYEPKVFFYNNTNYIVLAVVVVVVV